MLGSGAMLGNWFGSSVQELIEPSSLIGAVKLTLAIDGLLKFVVLGGYPANVWKRPLTLKRDAGNVSPSKPEFAADQPLKVPSEFMVLLYSAFPEYPWKIGRAHV